MRLADRSVCIGPPAARDSYLNQSNVIGAAETTGCDALHPGYGFLSESPSFVRACEDNDLIFIGPTPESMEVLGDKSLAKGAMRDAGHAARARLGGPPGGRRRGAARGRATSAIPCCSRPPRAAAGAACARSASPRSSRRPTRRRRPRPRRPSATAGSTSRRSCSTRTTSRCRWWATARAARSWWASASAACSAATRSCSRSRPRRSSASETRAGALRRRARRRARDALPQRRHDRVPARRRPVLLLHGDEHAAPGRASRSARR